MKEAMNWQEFKAVAHSPQREAAEFEKGRMWRAARWLGVRVAFILFRLNVSANGVSVLAVLCGVVAMAGVVWNAALPRWAGIVVLVCCYGAIFLDFCDGPLARARGSSGLLGRILDGVGTDFLREGLLIGLGVAAGATTFLLAAVVSGHFIVSVRNQFVWNNIAFDVKPDSGIVGRLIRAAFSVVGMLGVLPMFVAIASLSGFMRMCSRAIVAFYLALCLAWFVTACLTARKPICALTH